MQALHAFKRVLDATLRWFCIVFFAALVLLVVWQVFVRQVLNSGNAWTEAMARVVFIWQGIIGAAYVIGEKDDVAIDFLVRRFPTAVVRGIEILAHAIVAFFAIWVMVLGGGQIIANTWDDTVELLPLTQGQIYLGVPVAGVLIAVYCLIHIIDTFTKRIEVVDADRVDITQLTDEGI